MYQNVEEYYEDLLELIKRELDLYTRYAVRTRDDGGIRHIYNTKIFKEELSNILEDAFTDTNWKKYEFERKILREQWRQFHDKAYSSIKNGCMLPFEYLLRRFQLTEFEKYCVCLGFAPELNREFERMYCYLQDDYSMKYPTLDLCIKMFSMDVAMQKQLIHQTYFRKEILSYVFMDRQKNQDSSLSWKMKLREKIIEFIFFYNADLHTKNTDYYLGKRKKNIALNVNEQIESCLKDYFKQDANQQNRIVILEGPLGSGKKMQIQLAVDSQKQNVMYVDLRGIVNTRREERKDKIIDVIGRAVLDRAQICFCHLEAMSEKEEWNVFLFREILEKTSSFFQTVFFTTQENLQIEEHIPNEYQMEYFRLRLPSIQQRIKLWKYYLQGVALAKEVQIEVLAAQFDFTPGTMENAAKSAIQNAVSQGRKALDAALLYEACQQKVMHKLGERASRVNGRYTWDELVLEKEQKDMLRQALNQVSYRYRVYEEWGFQEKLAYGRGVSMLFAGPPGTGKTMAAQVLAKELGLELYKVDLSGVLSKYVGETQKNLREIFDEVQKSRSILFFDEADVLFNKRVNVTDSRDISANSQTAYLLQKMEEYDGITILATNLIQNFDDAYKRRMKYIIQFKLPQKDQRKEMWKKVFPKSMPVDEDIDLDFLASEFELSGASIKNIVLNAAFLAAAESEVAGMKHIIKALQQEYKKAGKILGQDELKEYYMY